MEITTIILVSLVILFIVANALGLGLGFLLAKSRGKKKQDSQDQR